MHWKWSMKINHNWAHWRLAASSCVSVYFKLPVPSLLNTGRTTVTHKYEEQWLWVTSPPCCCPEAFFKLPPFLSSVGHQSGASLQWPVCTLSYSSHHFSSFSFGNRQEKCCKHLNSKAPEGAGMTGWRVKEKEKEEDLEEVKSERLGEEAEGSHCWIRRSDCTWKDWAWEPHSL